MPKLKLTQLTLKIECIADVPMIFQRGKWRVPKKPKKGAAEAPTALVFEIIKLVQEIKGAVTVPDRVLREIANMLMPLIIKQLLVGMIPAEFNQFLLQQYRGSKQQRGEEIAIEGEFNISGPPLGVLDAPIFDVSFLKELEKSNPTGQQKQQHQDAQRALDSLNLNVQQAFILASIRPDIQVAAAPSVASSSSTHSDQSDPGLIPVPGIASSHSSSASSSHAPPSSGIGNFRSISDLVRYYLRCQQKEAGVWVSLVGAWQQAIDRMCHELKPADAPEEQRQTLSFSDLMLCVHSLSRKPTDIQVSVTQLRMSLNIDAVFVMAKTLAVRIAEERERKEGNKLDRKQLRRRLQRRKALKEGLLLMDKVLDISKKSVTTASLCVGVDVSGLGEYVPKLAVNVKDIVFEGPIPSVGLGVGSLFAWLSTFGLALHTQAADNGAYNIQVLMERSASGTTGQSVLPRPFSAPSAASAASSNHNKTLAGANRVPGPLPHKQDLVQCMSIAIQSLSFALRVNLPELMQVAASASTFTGSPTNFDGLFLSFAKKKHTEDKKDEEDDAVDDTQSRASSSESNLRNEVTANDGNKAALELKGSSFTSVSLFLNQVDILADLSLLLEHGVKVAKTFIQQNQAFNGISRQSQQSQPDELSAEEAILGKVVEAVDRYLFNEHFKVVLHLFVAVNSENSNLWVKVNGEMSDDASRPCVLIQTRIELMSILDDIMSLLA
eukprot:TRINITY_DN10832_c0_g1_i2.p1 TRINITY_DN10832_c0_g1~~TRINITY_DN10832_c0_g1_i2.p1  ORF type:complete len:722 (-),score=191.33 TRINITY_DN10832_c0_g1_i2:50-2215(-)